MPASRRAHAAAAADAGAGLRDPRARLRRRRDGHREPQPARVQRLQGLLGDGARSSRRTTAGSPRRSRRSAAADLPRDDAGKVGRRRVVDRYLEPSPGSPRTARDLAIVYTPLHGVGGTSVAHARDRRVHAPHIVEQQESPTPNSRRCVPQPRGEGRDGPRVALATESAPTSSSPTTPTPTARRRRSRPARLAPAHRQPGRHAARPTTSSRAAASASSPRRRLVAAARRDRAAPAPQRRSPASSGSPPRSRAVVFGYEEALGYSVGPARPRQGRCLGAVLIAELAAAAKARLTGLPASSTRSPTSRAAPHRAGLARVADLAEILALGMAQVPRLPHRPSSPASRSRRSSTSRRATDKFPPADVLRLQARRRPSRDHAGRAAPSRSSRTTTRS